MDENKNRRPVVLWGTYDTGKPRVRILRSACELIDTHLVECHYIRQWPDPLNATV